MSKDEEGVSLVENTATEEEQGVSPSRRAPLDCRLRFSVIIPAYNEAGFIGACLDSLLLQDFTDPYEIIVVDNNSTDDTALIAESRGVIVVREERQGVCWARQRGTELAAGEIIVSTDADTLYRSDWLSRIDREFRSDRTRIAVAGPFLFLDAPWWGKAWTRGLFGYVRVVSRVVKRVPYIAAANVAFLKSAWTGYNTHATQGGDELDLLRNLQARGTVAYVPDNAVFTSSRRLAQGLIYNILVALFYYYVIGYMMNRLASRPVIGMAPAFRSAEPRRARRWRLLLAGGFLIFSLSFGEFVVRHVYWRG
ncbi:MAG TPA: glycosyltransferase family 2 protein [Trebonia sp.]|nr:glycosyltransferase family 2 protein [Trebonia sp.]